MDQAGIKVVLESEVDKAIKNTQAFNATLGDLSAQAKGLTNTLGGATTAIDKEGAAAGKASGKFVLFNKQMLGTSSVMRSFTSSAKLAELRFDGFTHSFIFGRAQAKQTTEATNNLSASLKKLQGSTGNANGALSGFSNILRDAPYGIIGIGNNITQLTDAFRQLQISTGSTKAALSATIGSLFSPAGLFTIGLSSAISLWTVYSQRQQHAAAEAKKAAVEIKGLSEILRETARSISQHNASAGAEVATLNRLFAVAKNDTESRKTRIAALNELKEATNGYLSSLTLETIGTDKARASLDAFNRSLFQGALLKAYEGQVQELAKSFAAQERNAAQGKKALEEFNAVLLRQRQANDVNRTAPDQASFNRDMKNVRAREDIIRQTNNAIKEQNRLQEELLATGTKIADLEIALNPFKKDPDGKTATTAIKTISDILKELEKDITGLNVAFSAMGGSLTDLAGDKLKKFEKALQDLSDLGVRPGDNVFNLLQTQIEQLQSSLNRTPVTFKIPVVIEAVPRAVFNFTAFDKSVQEFKSTILNPFQKAISEGTNQAIRSGVSNLASGIGSAVGELIGGGKSIQDAFNGIIGIFGGFIKQLGESMIAAGTAAIAAKLLIKNPYTAVAAGIIAVAAGAAIQASLNKAPSFATGGIANSPMLALIGDNPGRREAIVPSEDWREAFGGIRGGNGFIAEAKVSGTDLLLLLKRAGMQQGRANG